MVFDAGCQVSHRHVQRRIEIPWKPLITPQIKMDRVMEDPTC
jgi:hypothetical protein